MSASLPARDSVTFTIATLADTLAASHRAGEMAASAGFGKRAAWELGIAVSELATNITRHAGSGAITLRAVAGPPAGIEIVAVDGGVGIQDVEAAMEDDYSAGRLLTGNVAPGDRGGLGSGLGAVRRFTDSMRIESTPGHGTIVYAFKQASASEGGEAGPVLLLGLGNTLLSDDAVGIHVVRHIAEEGGIAGVDLKEAEVAGFALLDLLEGYETAVVVDAVRVADAGPGEVVLFDGTGLDPSLHLVAGHQIDLPSALELGRRLGRPVPTSVTIVGVQIVDDRTCCESCTPAVAAAVPEAARIATRVAQAATKRRARG